MREFFAATWNCNVQIYPNEEFGHCRNSAGAVFIPPSYAVPDSLSCFQDRLNAVHSSKL